MYFYWKGKVTAKESGERAFNAAGGEGKGEVARQETLDRLHASAVKRGKIYIKRPLLYSFLEYVSLLKIMFLLLALTQL